MKKVLLVEYHAVFQLLMKNMCFMCFHLSSFMIKVGQSGGVIILFLFCERLPFSVIKITCMERLFLHGFESVSSVTQTNYSHFTVTCNFKTAESITCHCPS